MRYIQQEILIIWLVFITLFAGAQNKSVPVCRIEDGKIVFRIDLKWSEDKKNEIAKQFDLDSAVLANAYKGLTNFTVNNENWVVIKVTGSLADLTKALDTKPLPFVDKNDVFLTYDNGERMVSFAGPLPANYGVNRLDDSRVFNYIDNIALFYLPKEEKAKRVYLSGSFNGWSTSQTPMHKTDTGWVVKLNLQPGKYSYKYIVDGKWIHDPNNSIKERDGNRGYNSIIYCYNYQFKLSGNVNARKVVVSGSFNSWNNSELQMQLNKSGWILPIYLREGTHAYKFIVDNNWITDPGNAVQRPDGRGNINSFLGIGDKYLFKLIGYTNANKVFLAGNFNAWNPSELEMEKTNDGWQLEYYLGAGSYEYKFIVDGKWITDPQNPIKTGSGDFTNSFFVFKPNHTFVLKKFLSAKEVIVTGSFNGWDRNNYKMYKRNGEWYLPTHLKPGKYTYKFIVDGEWIIDPDNTLWEENEYGTGNSVLWIEPQY